MIYAAEIDINNIVQRVIVAPSIAWCVDTLGGRWVQTFMDGAVRGKYAGVGDTYDEDQDEFVSPTGENQVKSLLTAFLFASGCASHTAQIAASANDVRAAVGAARGHLEAARGNLDQIEIAAANVHEQLGYVQDTISPIYLTLQYASAAVVLVAIAIGIYIIKK